MDVEVTIDDSKTNTKPWITPITRYTPFPDTDLLECICEKNEDPQHVAGK
jgi:hypothetical protein